jgi:hypothetical protein
MANRSAYWSRALGYGCAADDRTAVGEIIAVQKVEKPKKV